MPVRVGGLPPVRAVEAADDHSCAITEAGDVYCWGLVYGEWPELERAQGFSTLPTQVDGLQNIAELALGKVYAAALNRDGKLFQWGGETRSSASDRSISQRRAAAASHLTGTYRRVAVGRSLLCAATHETVTCAGLYTDEHGDDDLDYDCLGVAKDDPMCRPFDLDFDKPELVTIAQLDPSSPDYNWFRDDAICAIGADGSFSCARRVRAEISTEGARWSRFESLGAPPMRAAREALALGRSGELFDIAFAASSACSADGCKLRRLPLDELTRGGEEVALGAGHSCVVRGAEVVCWGDNASGQLGNGSRSTSAEPQLVKLTGSDAGEETVDQRERYASLRAKLPTKKVSGFGLVFANAELFETADAPKSLGRLASFDDTLLMEQGEPRYLVSITEDRGSRVGVRLIPNGNAAAHCAGVSPMPPVALRGFVERDALAPVIGKRARIAFDDDWLELRPGTPVYLDEHGMSALVFGERVPLDVPEAAIGLSYARSYQRRLDNEGTLQVTVGGRRFKKLTGNFANESAGVEEQDDGTEREREHVFHTCTDAMASNLSFNTLPVPSTEEREWGFGWVDAGVTARYASGKRAGEVGALLHLRADRLTSRSSRKCFRAVGEIELCFDEPHVNESRGD